VFDLANKCANAATVVAGPMVFVRRASRSCWLADFVLGAWADVGVEVYSPDMAALLTRASMLHQSVSDIGIGYEREGIATHRPYLSPTSLAALETLSSESTSICTTSAIPGRLRSRRAWAAAEPLVEERLPRRTMLEGDSRRRAARAKPMPLFAGGGLVLVGEFGM
jgi:hypothetical protein